jgi:phosphate transport system permease protein
MDSNLNIDNLDDENTVNNSKEFIKSELNVEFQAERKENLKENIMVNKYIIHKPLQYGKKLYIGEFLAERFIQIVAVLSICAIIAIFYYVFQEATYAFKSPLKTTVSESKSTQSNQQQNKESANNDLKQGVYNPNENTSDNNSELKQESYSPNGTSKTEDDKNIIDNNANSNKSVEIDNSEKPVTIKELITANGYIDNKPDYIWQPIATVPKYSFIPLFFGALKVTLIGLLIASPIAILAAIYTVAFAPKWIKEILKPAIEILAGFPSVVIGFFCLITLATVIQELFHTTYRLNSFVGGIGMALAVIPIIYTITEDALSAVPKYMKEASFALGASRWQTAWRVLLTSATPGVFAALILGFGRAFGETMIALMATGNAALVSMDIFESVRTMAATIGAEMAEVEFRGIHYGVLFLIGAVLFIVTFTLNAVAEFYVRKKLMKKFQGM